MTCSDARAAMLAAERSALRGDDDSLLAQHVRECAGCRALAMSIDRDTSLLASTVALRGVTEDDQSIARRRNRVAFAMIALPMAATIVVALLLRMRGDGVGRANRELPVADGRIAMNVVSVDVAPGQTAAVIRTKDPKVTIVWISTGGTQ